MGEEHRDAGAIGTGVKHLVGFVGIGVELDLGLPVEGTLPSEQVIAIDGVGGGVAGEAIKGLGIGPLAIKSPNGANTG